ncbi:hypothetical protein PF008_g9043 [Phytophthora fragariae]|uniref:Secreted protein n=1 Tax=Phytophthora fragariae TaxID=53985 RepID=A0A6G0RXU0_9STRA|nr:hypothetical protein PF008_g9043 [Phytophthora fragariae]
MSGIACLFLGVMWCKSTVAVFSLCSRSTCVCAAFPELYDGKKTASIRRGVALLPSCGRDLRSYVLGCSASFAVVFASRRLAWLARECESECHVNFKVALRICTDSRHLDLRLYEICTTHTGTRFLKKSVYWLLSNSKTRNLYENSPRESVQ